MAKPEKFDLLVALYIYFITVSELMGGKTFPLAKIFGYQLNASVAIFVLPLIYTINDVITEVYGKERTRSVIVSGFIVIVLIMLFSFLATSLPPSARFLQTERAYDTIFGFSIRIAASSLTAFAVSEFLDVLIFVRMRAMLGKRGLWLRNNVSNILSAFFDTAVFISLAFYAFGRPFAANVEFLWSLILPYWLLKCFMSVIETPLVYVGVRWLKKPQA